MSMPRNEKKYWVALAHCEALLPLHWKRLLAVFPNVEALWHASALHLENAGLTSRVATEVVAIRNGVDPDRAMERMEQNGIRAITIQDESYPALLKEIADPPYVLFVEGTLLPEEPVGALGVVGTRKISSYGKSVLPPIVTECVRAGLTIVSGLALGIDGVAHETTIAEGGRTIAVIGSGSDRKTIYPWQHRPLADRIIASGGAIISEYPPFTPPNQYHFPARNRIISGLSLGTLVCEAPEKSGALITAFAALDQNRDVFVIPGPIHHPNTFGIHELLKRGAIPVAHARDILETLPITPLAPTSHERTTSLIVKKRTPAEDRIITVLTGETLHIDEIVRRADLTAAVVMSTLVLMEMHGAIRNVGGMQYTIHT